MDSNRASYSIFSWTSYYGKWFKKITIEPYQTTMDTINDSSYRSKVLNNKINQMTSDKLDPLKRLDYFSFYALNSPFIYHYNGTSLYSSIFNGQILKYYDKTMQINMPVDKIVHIAI